MPGLASVHGGSRLHAYEALRDAVKAAIDAGLYERAAALLAVLADWAR